MVWNKAPCTAGALPAFLTDQMAMAATPGVHGASDHNSPCGLERPHVKEVDVFKCDALFRRHCRQRLILPARTGTYFCWILCLLTQLCD